MEKRAEEVEQVKLTQFQCILYIVNNASWAVYHGCCLHSFLTGSVTQHSSSLCLPLCVPACMSGYVQAYECRHVFNVIIHLLVEVTKHKQVHGSLLIVFFVC